MIAATPAEAIRQTISSLRGTVGGKPGASFPGKPRVWLTETNMGIATADAPPACCLCECYSSTLPTLHDSASLLTDV